MDSATLQWIAGILTGLAAVAAALVKLVRPVRSFAFAVADRMRSAERQVTAEREWKASLRNMRRVSAVRHVLSELVAHNKVQRAMLLVANNGGEEWRGQGPIYVSNPAQVTAADEPNTQDMWQQWQADAWYLGMLGITLEKLPGRAGLLLLRENMEGELLDAYISQGTVASVVLPFMWEPGGVLWLVSLNFGRHPKVGSTPHPLDEQEMLTFVSTARALYMEPGACRMMIDKLRAAYRSV